MSFSSIMTYLGVSPVSLGWLSALILGAVIALAVSQLLEGIQGTARSVIIASPPVAPVTYATQGCQTDNNTKNASSPPVVNCKETAEGVIPVAASHGLEEIFNIFSKQGSAALSDEDLISLVDANRIQARNLEKEIGDYKRAVLIRRKIMQRSIKLSDGLSYDNFDYSKVFGACCENVIGYVGLPVGIAGPLLVDGKQYFVPMATTEGCLVASTNRGCRAVSMSSSGITTRIIFDGMSRAPVVRFPSLVKCCEARDWMRENFSKLEATFNSSSRFARLQSIDTRVVGKLLYIRFVASTGDAMGMNMVSKGTDLTLKLIQKHFRDMEILALSGNYCTDKKAAAVNWIEGRGKSVIAEAIIPARVVKEVLKSSVPAIRDLNVAKNLVGSAMAGSIGGFNAHASNIVSAVFIATGQDPAQNVTSSNCMTYLDVAENGEDLYISCTMPSIEVGTVGGGTVLPSQAACLEILGVNGPDLLNPGNNSRTLASVVCATVLAGELSLMSALAAGDLVKSHLKYNRSSSNIAASLGAAKPLVKPQVSSISLHASSKPHSRLPEVEAQVTVNVIDLPTECKQS